MSARRLAAAAGAVAAAAALALAAGPFAQGWREGRAMRAELRSGGYAVVHVAGTRGRERVRRTAQAWALGRP